MPQSRKPKLGRVYKKYNRNPVTGEKVFHSTWTLRFQGKDRATGATDYKLAERQLLKLIGESTQEKRRELQGAGGVLVSNLLSLVLREYEREGKSSIAMVRGHINNHLLPALGTRRAIDLTVEHIDGYKDLKIAKELKPSTINRHLKVLARGYKLAIKARKLSVSPPKSIT